MNPLSAAHLAEACCIGYPFCSLHYSMDQGRTICPQMYQQRAVDLSSSALAIHTSTATLNEPPPVFLRPPAVFNSLDASGSRLCRPVAVWMFGNESFVECDGPGHTTDSGHNAGWSCMVPESMLRALDIRHMITEHFGLMSL